MKKILLSRDRHLVVDSKDYELVSKYSWYVTGTQDRPYVMTDIYNKGRSERVYIHNMLMGAKGIDHINGDTLDNRRSNLRKCTQQQNTWNSIGYGRSGYKGIYESKNKKRWHAKLFYDGNRVNIGTFDIKEEAAYIYDQFAMQLFGEFARLNIL